MFRTKEVKNILRKKEKNVGNYLGEGKSGRVDREYLEYEENKKMLKNKKISNMMTMNRNN